MVVSSGRPVDDGGLAVEEGLPGEVDSDDGGLVVVVVPMAGVEPPGGVPPAGAEAVGVTAGRLGSAAGCSLVGPPV